LLVFSLRGPKGYGLRHAWPESLQTGPGIQPLLGLSPPIPPRHKPPHPLHKRRSGSSQAGQGRELCHTAAATNSLQRRSVHAASAACGTRLRGRGAAMPLTCSIQAPASPPPPPGTAGSGAGACRSRRCTLQPQHAPVGG
jgi:hypothetical protein